MSKSVLADESAAYERLLTETELAKLLNVALPTVRQWIQQKRIPYVRLGWRLVRIRLSDIEAYLDRHFVPAREVPVPVRSKRNEKKWDVPQEAATDA